MADEKKQKTVEVPLDVLTKMQKDIADATTAAENARIRAEAAEAAANSSLNTIGKETLREKKSADPKFRTVRLRKYPVAGNFDDQDYVIGWTKRGAYQEVDRSGISPQTVDMIEIIFLRNPKKAEKVRLLDFLNKGEQMECIVASQKKETAKVPTGETITVQEYDPKRGIMNETGETIDGYFMQEEITYTLQVPGLDAPIEVNGAFVNG